MGKVALEGLEFFAYHGFYKSERQSGNKFGVDVEVETGFEGAALEDNLKKTVNYEELYRLVKQEMEQPAQLLEHLAWRICQQVLQGFPEVHAATVTVRKFNPPIGGICHSARVTFTQKRSQ